jgi:hypothetical protein
VDEASAPQHNILLGLPDLLVDPAQRAPRPVGLVAGGPPGLSS